MNVLIVGGTSGLGLALARKLKSEKHGVIVTGRENRHPNEFRFRRLYIGAGHSDMLYHIERVFYPTFDDSTMPRAMTDPALPEIDMLIYAAGYFQSGTITEITFNEKLEMMHVGLLAPVLLVERLLMRQRSLGGLIAISSTSQWTPRLREFMYCGVKGGLAMITQSLALDPRIGRTLLAAPSGMKEPDGSTRFFPADWDTSKFLPYPWVAEQIVTKWYDEWENPKYAGIKILGGDSGPRVEPLE